MIIKKEQTNSADMTASDSECIGGTNEASADVTRSEIKWMECTMEQTVMT